MPDSLPDSIVEAIAISNAKSIGEQPAVLANMQLANQVLNNNMAQQAMIRQQEVLSQISAAAVAKCVSVILGSTTDGGGGGGKNIGEFQDLLAMITGAVPKNAVDPPSPSSHVATDPSQHNVDPVFRSSNPDPSTSDLNAEDGDEAGSQVRSAAQDESINIEISRKAARKAKKKKKKKKKNKS